MKGKETHKPSKRATRDGSRTKGKAFAHGGRHKASTFKAPRIR